LALVDPDPGTLIAFNAAPGTVAQNEAGPYSSYAQALAEMMRKGGLPATDLFNRVRLRVNDATKGAQVPWNASKLEAPFYFFERAPDAPPPQVSPEQTSSIRSKPIRDFDARDAYLAALDRDNLQDYENFLRAYPNDPMARRVQAIVAARREAVHRQVGALRKVLSQQTIGILVRPALPRALRIAKIDVDFGRQRKPTMIGKFLSPVPGQGLIQLLG
jgi:uncharacterized caspase-like protein